MFTTFETVENNGKTEYFLTQLDGSRKKVVRTQEELDSLMQKLYFEECEEFSRLTSNGRNEDHLREVSMSDFEKGHEYLFARMNVQNTAKNLLILTYYLLFDEINERFDI